METSSFNRSFTFIRHGQTEWNRLRIYQGSNDVPLNDVGKAQALELSKRLSLEGVTEIFSSPLKRARETAEIIINNSQKPITLNLVPELMECRSEESARFILNLKGVKKLPSFERL